MTSITCNLKAFDAEQEKRYRVILMTLRSAVKQVGERENGFSFAFSPDADTCMAAMEFVTLERLCCPFLTFHLELEPQGGVLTLTLTGPEGTKDILAEFAEPFINGIGS